MNLPKGVTEEQIGSCLTPRLQELIILPTEKCNFRCTYCYEDFLIGKMPPAIERGVKALIDRRSDSLDRLEISWFGGEPLLAADVVLRIARHSHKRSEEFGFELRGGLTTNGYLLTRDLAEELLTLKQNFFQISLDGWRSGHDATRKLANGRGTFDRLWTNLSNLHRITGQFDVLLRVHVSSTNLDSLEQLCLEVAKAFGADPRFRVDFQDIRDMGGAGGGNVVPLHHDDFQARIQHLSKILNASESGPIRISSKLENVGESAGGQRLEDRRDGDAYICYAAKPNSLMIRANGRLGKCTVALNSPANDVGHICEDGTLVIDNPKLRRWFHGFETLSIDSLGCPLHTLPRQDIGGDAQSSPAVTRGGREFPVPLRVKMAAGSNTKGTQ